MCAAAKGANKADVPEGGRAEREPVAPVQQADAETRLVFVLRWVPEEEDLGSSDTDESEEEEEEEEEEDVDEEDEEDEEDEDEDEEDDDDDEEEEEEEEEDEEEEEELEEDEDDEEEEEEEEEAKEEEAEAGVLFWEDRPCKEFLDTVKRMSRNIYDNSDEGFGDAEAASTARVPCDPAVVAATRERDGVRERETVVAMLVVRLARPTGELLQLFVDPDYRHAGIGDLLTRRALALAAAHGATRLEVFAAGGSPAFYRRCGFFDVPDDAASSHDKTRPPNGKLLMKALTAADARAGDGDANDGTCHVVEQPAPQVKVTGGE
eukprot:TRINITY_DN2467_c1_g2_i1.p1 TRINITY_DN2467_c1_g2~~TRINITY_DN2467_c1_g2_i1.p1  ORF type:complete len:321 (+),score=141.25 TRINITY_DN2467_c1_g2_i1:11-973(+)